MSKKKRFSKKINRDAEYLLSLEKHSYRYDDGDNDDSDFDDSEPYSNSDLGSESFNSNIEYDDDLFYEDKSVSESLCADGEPKCDADCCEESDFPCTPDDIKGGSERKEENLVQEGMNTSDSESVAAQDDDWTDFCIPSADVNNAALSKAQSPDPYPQDPYAYLDKSMYGQHYYLGLIPKAAKHPKGKKEPKAKQITAPNAVIKPTFGACLPQTPVVFNFYTININAPSTPAPAPSGQQYIETTFTDKERS